METTGLTVGRGRRPGLISIDRLLEAALLRRLKTLRAGALRLCLPDGDERVFTGSEAGPQADLTILAPRFFRRVVWGGDLGFAEAFMDGDWLSSDPVALLSLAVMNRDVLEDAIPGLPWKRLTARLQHLARPNSHRGSKRNIARHYDLGNDFYGAWLDRTMTYSAAVFDQGHDDLAAAQVRKFRHLAELARIRPGDHVLEIGCGWGGFAIWAALELGCRVTAVTISQAQHDYVRERIRALNIEDRVELKRQDYRSIEGQYDGIVSIEMLEAVGARYWPQYFAKLRSCLSPGGRAAIQVITIDDARYESYRQGADFIQTYIFPGGFLPSVAALQQPVADAGMALVDDRGYGLDYARTLAHWQDRFDAAWQDIAAQGFDERFRRMWSYYLAYCRAGFTTGRIDLRQLALVAC